MIISTVTSLHIDSVFEHDNLQGGTVVDEGEFAREMMEKAYRNYSKQRSQGVEK